MTDRQTEDLAHFLKGCSPISGEEWELYRSQKTRLSSLIKEITESFGPFAAIDLLNDELSGLPPRSSPQAGRPRGYDPALVWAMAKAGIGSGDSAPTLAEKVARIVPSVAGKGNAYNLKRNIGRLKREAEKRGGPWLLVLKTELLREAHENKQDDPLLASVITQMAEALPFTYQPNALREQRLLDFAADCLIGDGTIGSGRAVYVHGARLTDEQAQRIVLAFWRPPLGLAPGGKNPN